MKKLTPLILVVIATFFLVGFCPPPDLHCPEGWVAKYQIEGGWENPSGGNFWLSTSVGFPRGLDAVGSSTHDLTGYCVKYSKSNTGILGLDTLPWRADKHDASYYVLYAEEETQDEEKKTPCTWRQYVLRDTEGHICYIKRNYIRGDVASKLPIIYDDTSLMRELCSYDCLGNYVQDFGKLDIFWTTCAQCDGVCQ